MTLPLTLKLKKYFSNFVAAWGHRQSILHEYIVFCTNTSYFAQIHRILIIVFCVYFLLHMVTIGIIAETSMKIERLQIVSFAQLLRDTVDFHLM